MRTTHAVLFSDARSVEGLGDGSVGLVLTSPPYPLVEMWDPLFSGLSPEFATALGRDDGGAAFEAAHAELDAAWRSCFRALKPGGFACINIGDATRTLGGQFRLYPNHARIVTDMSRLGFTPLPDILWRKPTNAPNKFMGSGMLPAGAYVTYEHEYILIFRKGGARAFSRAEDRENRRRSAFFWEERNVWFSDVWTDLKGASQQVGDGVARTRSGAYPFELAYRLIHMYSVVGDTVLDPFLGTGTTSSAAIAAQRHSIGVEVDRTLEAAVRATLQAALPTASRRVADRLADHRAFVASRLASGQTLKHQNAHYGFPVMTSQERSLVLSRPVRLEETGPMRFEVQHEIVEGGEEKPTSTHIQQITKTDFVKWRSRVNGYKNL